MSSTIEKELVEVMGPGLCRVPRKGVSSDAASATAKTRGRRGSKLDASRCSNRSSACMIAIKIFALTPRRRRHIFFATRLKLAHAPAGEPAPPGADSGGNAFAGACTKQLRRATS